MKKPLPVVLMALDYLLTAGLCIFTFLLLRGYTYPFSGLTRVILGAFSWLSPILYLVVAYGLIQLKNWSRTVILILKCCALVGGILIFLSFMGSLLIALHYSGASLINILRSSLSRQLLLGPSLIVTSLVALSYLRNPAVRAAFEEGHAPGFTNTGHFQEVYGFSLPWVAWSVCSLLLLGISLHGIMTARSYYDQSVLENDQLLNPSLSDLERKAASVKSSQERFYMLEKLANAAYREGQFDKARDYAQEMLRRASDFPGDWNYGNAIHHGHLILGRLALREGHLEEAKRELLAAGKTPGSPQLNSFGPNMRLANELLEKGERDTVIQYFALCKIFWKSGTAQLDEWTDIVQKGGIPTFGANLIY